MSQQSAMQKAFAGGLYHEKGVARGPQVFNALPKFDPENAQVFFDFEIGSSGVILWEGRVVFEVFTKQVPKTAANFLAIATGKNNHGLIYKDCTFH